MGYQVLSMEIHGQALTARVQFERPDGHKKEARYSWPVKITRTEIEKILEAFWQEFLREPARPPVLHEAMELVGQPPVMGEETPERMT